MQPFIFISNLVTYIRRSLCQIMKVLLIIICQSRDCWSNDCQSNDCRSNDCRSNECRSNDCRSNDPDPFTILSIKHLTLEKI